MDLVISKCHKLGKHNGEWNHVKRRTSLIRPVKKVTRHIIFSCKEKKRKRYTKDYLESLHLFHFGWWIRIICWDINLSINALLLNCVINMNVLRKKKKNKRKKVKLIY